MSYAKILAAVVITGMASTAVIQADTFDKKTTISIDAPVMLPNTTLQAGTYVLKLVDTSTYRHVVRVYDKDEKHLITTILAIPNAKLTRTGKTEIMFWETPAGQPKAMRAWFYPGDTFGQEFKYPKEAADRISAYAKTTVPVLDNDDKTAVVASDTTTLTERKEEAVVVAAAPAAPPPAPVLQAQAEPAPPMVTPAPEPAQPVREQPAPATLPKTASNVPLIGLLGLLSIGSALAIRARVRGII